MFPKNCWYVGAWDHELANGLFARRILDEDLVFYRTEKGEPVALVDRCCHRLAPLSHGRLEGDTLRCMYHGLAFDPTGHCVDVPGQDRISPALKVRRFPTVERDRYIWVWMGDPALADPARIVDRHWQQHTDWRSIPGYLHYQADYRLIIDNLLDFSHLSFVHAETLGGSRSMAETPPKIERFDWGLRFTRWYLRDPLPPYLKEVAPFAGPVDRWQIYEWRIAGNLLDMDSGVAPAGTGAPEGRRPPEALQFHSVQSLTPETENTTHYFWTYPHNFALDDPSITEELAAQLRIAFREDQVMIEAQQAVLRRHADQRMIMIGADAGVVQGRHMLDQMIKAESEAPI